ncbi:unnamed protein product, partial [Protopolystoma xenopodis]
EFYKAIDNCNEVISRDTENVKALYRRGKCYFETWDLDLAEADLKRAAKLSPSLAAMVQTDLATLAEKKRNREMADRRLLAGKMSLQSSNG